MERKAAFILALLITALFVGNYLFFTDKGLVREPVEISRVLDGDTVELEDGRKIRLLNINTPEKGLQYSDLAKNFLTQYTTVELEAVGTDIYDRTLGRLYDGEYYLNLEIVAQGMAHTYLVDDGENSLFARAEQEARKAQRGLWQLSNDADCVSATINKYDEYVTIIEECDLDTADWTIKDESTKTYKIASDMPQEFTIYSAKGSDTEDAVYWGREHIWNDDHDEVFIRDADGLLLYYDSYG